MYYLNIILYDVNTTTFIYVLDNWSIFTKLVLFTGRSTRNGEYMCVTSLDKRSLWMDN